MNRLRKLIVATVCSLSLAVPAVLAVTATPATAHAQIEQQFGVWYRSKTLGGPFGLYYVGTAAAAK